MKKLMVGLLIATSASLALAENGKTLFTLALNNGDLAKRLQALGENAEILSLKKVFILAGRGSHTNVEVTYGKREQNTDTHVTCFPLTLVEYIEPITGPEIGTEHFQTVTYMVPAGEECRN